METWASRALDAIDALEWLCLWWLMCAGHEVGMLVASTLRRRHGTTTRRCDEQDTDAHADA